MSGVYRDPVSHLAIVSLEAMDRKARDAFRRLLQLLPPTGGVIPVILYYVHVVRRTRRGKGVPCYLLVSRSHWYLYKPTGELSRCSPVERVAKVILCRDMHVVWKVPQERDAVMRFDDTGEIAFLTNVLRTLRVAMSGGSASFSVENRSGVSYTKLDAPDAVQLEHTAENEDEWPLPLVVADEAQRQYTVEDVVVLMPPPPPPPPQQQQSLSSPSPLPPPMNANNEAQWESRVEAIMRYLDGEAESPSALDVPAIADYPGVIPPHPQPPAAAAKEERVSSPPTEGGSSIVESTPASTIRLIQPVTASAAAAAEQHQVSPPPRTPHLATSTSAVEGEAAATASRPPPPPSFTPLWGRDSGSTPEMHSLVRELRDMASRLASLEQLNESLRRSHARDDNRAVSPVPPQTKENSDSLNIPRSLPTSPFVRLTPPPRITLQSEAAGVGAAEFERRIASKKLDERLLLRDYEIGAKYRQVSACMAKGDLQQLLLVARLQEDLLLLLRAQKVDDKTAAMRRGEHNNDHVNAPRAVDPPTSGGVCGVADEKKRAGEEEEEEEGGAGCDDTSDYEVWAATHVGVQWHSDRFGEHLSACKKKMVEDIFRGSATPS
ncbi:hypothetical protein DQ04_06511040 [Trypanosoma grayi]|uniref:hypothetical protein n=1 Tax=Trypanosoma grayi TaxID=71804 RepID=UPI0004F4084B|nr:hypothetical protein DQ04_06511040 [Trypanosoma grayi]KEG08750.1 hypothetical protein DQ04_06511040 [Trypanosoma grayi]